MKEHNPYVRAYQCSKCAELEDMDEYCYCSHVADIRPCYRQKGDAKECLKYFKELSESERWHEEFYWEMGMR